MVTTAGRGGRGSTDRPGGSPAHPAFETLAVHAGQEPDELTGAVAPPIYQTSTYRQEAVGRPTRGYEYARTQNPTRERLERAVAALEGRRRRAHRQGSRQDIVDLRIRHTT